MGTPAFKKNDYFSSEILGLRLAKARDKADFTQKGAAKALKVSQTWISKSENGFRKVGVFDLLEMAELYGVDITEFFAPPREDERAALDERKQLAQERHWKKY
jgi:transcriptional regulator with XRE-family HTH domain